MRKNKIMYVHHAGTFGGAPKSLSYIIEKLDRDVFDPYLVSIAEGPINEFFKQLPAKFFQISGVRPFHGSTVVEKSVKLFLRNLIFFIPSIYKSLKFIRKVNPDIIHLNSSSLLAFAISGRILGKIVICHLREPLRKGVWGFVPRMNNFFVDGYISISKYDLKSMRIPSFLRLQYRVIPNFVDTFDDKSVDFNLFDMIIPEKKDVTIFLYLARFSSSNGWENLIHFGKKVIEKNNKIYFILVGSPDEVTYKKFESKNIFIFPFTKNIQNFIFNSDVFVCPFLTPHFARGIVEAYSGSLPILGNNIACVDELVLHEETGFLYNNYDEFEKYCLLLASEKKLRLSMGENGKVFSLKKFDFQKNLKDTYAFYNILLQKYEKDNN